jgi:hypothetical protein
MDQEPDSYRSTVVVDGDDNVIECQLTLIDYAGRPGGDLRDLFIDFHLTADQNRRLVSLLREFSVERVKELFFIPRRMPLQCYSLGSGITRAAIGVENSALTPKEVFSLYEENREQAQPPMDDDCDQDGEGPIKRDRDDFDDNGEDMEKDDEPVSPWKVYDVKRKAMTHRTGHFEEVTNPDLERVSCKYQDCQEPAMIRQIFCECHLMMSTIDYHAEKEKSRLRRSLDGSAERSDCKYRAGGGIGCTNRAKKRQIYCAHHLYVASTKHLAEQEKSLMKRTTTDLEIYDPEVDYESLLKMEISPLKKRTKPDE